MTRLSRLEHELLDALGRLHCGALCMGTDDFSPAIWTRDLKRAEAVMVIASRIKADAAPPAVKEKYLRRRP